jgi:hypothetical protein
LSNSQTLEGSARGGGLYECSCRPVLDLEDLLGAEAADVAQHDCRLDAHNDREGVGEFVELGLVELAFPRGKGALDVLGRGGTPGSI